MGHGVDTGSRGKSLRCGHVHIGIDNGHFRHKLIIGKRIFYAGLFIGDNGERRDFTAGTGRGRNGDKVGFFTHLREGVDTLADIHKAHSHVHKVCFGMLV